MGEHERPSASDEWYTPEWLFEAIGVTFDLDPCADSRSRAWQWCESHEIANGLERAWNGSVWLNPPFGKRNGIRPWLEKLVEHGNGIALVPNRTGTDWWRFAAENSDALLFVFGKIKFFRPNGNTGDSPGYGNVLMAYGDEMATALIESKIKGIRCKVIHD